MNNYEELMSLSVLKVSRLRQKNLLQDPSNKKPYALLSTRIEAGLAFYF